jgi:hypothetical protein
VIRGAGRTVRGTYPCEPRRRFVGPSPRDSIWESARSNAVSSLRTRLAVPTASMTASCKTRREGSTGVRPASSTSASIETPNAFATARTVDSRGSGRPPVSSLATTPCGTPRAFARAAWVMPARSLARWIAFPKVVDELATSVVLPAQTRLPCTKRK